MNIAVYGGSFNPPHISHAMVASWCLWTGIVDQVWMVPVYRHAFEDTHGKKLASFAVRVQWCNTFSQDVHPRIVVSEVESKLPVPSYSIDTLRYLKLKYPEHQFRLMVGADVLSQIHEWKDWDSIAKEFTPIIVGRVGYEGAEESVSFPGISSTQIRTELAKGLVPTQTLTKGVQDLLREFNPYAS